MGISGCSEDRDISTQPVSITFQFSHSWDGAKLDDSDLATTTFTNEFGNELLINRLRYVISDIQLTHENGGTIELDDYQLVNVGVEESLTFTTSANIVAGNYSQVTFRFGFNQEDNIDGAYQDLTTAGFDVPLTLGGGYHYMQMDGTFIDSLQFTQPYNYHAIEAYDASDPNDILNEDTSINISVGEVLVGSNTRIQINMEVSEWFKNPNEWNLNELSTNLMGNFDAQILMNQNGSSGVFTLDFIEQ